MGCELFFISPGCYKIGGLGLQSFAQMTESCCRGNPIRFYTFICVSVHSWFQSAHESLSEPPPRSDETCVRHIRQKAVRIRRGTGLSSRCLRMASDRNFTTPPTPGGRFGFVSGKRLAGSLGRERIQNPLAIITPGGLITGAGIVSGNSC